MTRVPSKRRGFTLIELLIVVAIVGILAAIAIPAYNDQVRKTRRASAKAELMDLVQVKERFHTLNGTYVGSPCSPASANTDFYTFTCPTNTATTFDVLATVADDQLNDTRCLDLGLNQQGVRTISSTTGTVADCW